MAITFTEQFEQALSGQEGVRSSKIANTPLKILIEGSDRKDKKAMVELLTKGDLQNNTLREINENAEITEKFGRFFEQEGKNKKTAPKADKVLGSFQPFFQEGGYLGPKGNNPARILLQNVIGTKAIQELFPTETIRKVPSPYPFDTYPKLKTVVTNMLSSPDKATRLAGTQLAMHVIGGYRPSDFKNLKIENIDFKSGVVSDLEVKDRGKTTTKQGYFPKIIRDIILKEVDPSGQGLVFPIDNETTINAALKKANILTEYTTAGKVKQGVFTLEDTRKLNETHLTSLGYDEKNPVRLAATLRANKTTIGQYVATGAGGRDIEELFVKTSTPHVAFTGTTNHAQYLSDIGVKPSNIVKRYKVINDVIDRFPLDRVEEFQETYPTLSFSEDNKVITTTLSQVNEGNAKLYQEKSAADLQVEINKANIEAGETAVAAEEGKLKQAEAKKIVKEKSLLEKKNELAKKGGAAIDLLMDNVAKPIAKMIPPVMIGAGVKYGYDQFGKYRGEGFSPLESVGKSAVDVAGEFSPLGTAQAAVDLVTTEAGAGTLSDTTEQDMNLSNQIANQSQDTFLGNIQNLMGLNNSADNQQTNQVANTVPEDANVDSKMSTFGREPDVEAGFVTPPNRSELGNETERQLNQNSFLGAT
tara:strand:- start:152 stop:2083 length:1932 start_codon:yes stop_codon:yes gene_type:complete